MESPRRAKREPSLLLPICYGTIEATHQQVLQRLETVSDAELDKTGKHARGDVITIEEFFTRITEHRKQHAEELKKVVG